MKQRYISLVLVLVFVAFIFITRLAFLQLFTENYALNAVNTSIKAEYIIPQRGIIYDRNGKILVSNEPSYELVYTEASMGADFDTLAFCNLLRISPEEFISRIKNIRKEKYFSRFRPFTFSKNISREEIARIQEILFRFPAFEVMSRPQRKYEVSTSGNLLGYTNEVNNTEIKKDSLYYLPGDNIGKSGVERSYEKVLRGFKGVRYIQKGIKLNSIGPYKNGSLDKEEVSGKDIKLTIDYDLQKLAETLLVNKRGAIVALDPKTGEILVLATGPDVDPNLFAGPEKTQNILTLQKDLFNRPTFDRSIQAAYPPGSVFKLLTALAGMQMGVLDENTVYPCSGGSFNYKGLKIKGHGGSWSLIPSLQVSSNCYFSFAFLAIVNKYPGNPSKGIDEWKEIMNSFGLGVFLNNDLAVGVKGSIPDGAFYERVFKTKNWDAMQGPIFNGMGQGDVLLTPLQMANFLAVIANKGWYYTPHIVKSIDGKPNPDPRFQKKKRAKVDEKYYDPVVRGMEAVVLQGTAKSLKSKDFTQLAKTGTAQVPQGRDNSIFGLIAPAENPKIVVVAVMEHAGFGATWAGPASTLVAEKYITGSIKRQHLYQKMVQASFMPEYKRQWMEKMKGTDLGSRVKDDSNNVK
ncbi:MAG: peptidoglycan glycosyltransferase [Bergeyella sp.]|nr:peptidoglycan glycosyltransferase [Bergeyella sp.]